MDHEIEPNSSATLTTRPQRRLNLLDLLIVIAGCAGGLALGRYYVASEAYRHYSWGSERFALLEGWITCIGLVLTLTTLVLRVRPPRPSWHALGRQPGFIACLAVMASAVVRIPEVVLIYGPVGFRSSNFHNALFATVLAASGYGFPILVAWATLRLSGVWAPEAGTLDRLGRGLGWLWIAVFVLLHGFHWYLAA